MRVSLASGDYLEKICHFSVQREKELMPSSSLEAERALTPKDMAFPWGSIQPLRLREHKQQHQL